MTSMADNTDGALTSAQMLQMQQQVQQWTIMVEIQSTITSSWRTRSSPWCRNRAETHAARPATGAASRATARVGVGFRVGVLTGKHARQDFSRRRPAARAAAAPGACPHPVSPQARPRRRATRAPVPQALAGVRVQPAGQRASQASQRSVLGRWHGQRLLDERRMLIPRPALHLARRAIPDADPFRIAGGHQPAQGNLVQHRRQAPATDPGSPAPTRPPAPARSFSTALPRQPDCPAPAPGPGARRPCRARACDRSPRCRRRSAARPAASARPRCAGMPARHPGDAPWRDPGRRGDAPPGPAGGAWRECASRCRHACFFASRSRFARAWSSTRSRRRGGWLSPRPGNRLARLAAARWKRRGITRARRRQAYSRERPGFLPGQGCHTDAAGPSNPAHHPLPRYWSLAARAHDGWVDASADSSARSIAVDRSRHCCVPP